MHVLSRHNRSEFLATPQLVRFDYAKGVGFEPTLLIKATTLLLKYIARGVRMQLAFALLGDRLLYALKVYDDEEKPDLLWSILEREEEKAALVALSTGGTCRIFLFNELAVNVASVELLIPARTELASILARVQTGRVDHSMIIGEAQSVLDRFANEIASSQGLVIVDVPNTDTWSPVRNQFITSHATASPIDLFNKDEGRQQEQIGIWLTDNLHPRGVYRSPQIPKGNGFRELTDIFLSHEFGTVLIESKVLAILTRDNLPNRAKLARDIAAHIEKAINQLRGGMRRLKDGTQVTTADGVVLDVERTQPMHGIILIPDLELIEDRDVYGAELIHDFMKSTGGFLHLLDISELLRIVQAAEIIAARENQTTLMMAFDYYLIERVKKTADAGTLCIEVLFRLSED